MKRVLLSLMATVLMVVMFVFSANAAKPGDYGYYDVTDDGKVQIVDVLGILDRMLNTDEDISLTRVLGALRITTSSAVANASIKSINYNNQTVTLNCSYLENFVLPFSAFGFENEPNMVLYEEGKVVMTVPSPAKTFFENNFDASLVYAAKAECRYKTSDLVFTVGDVNATQNGEAVTLFAEPLIIDGVVMVPANVVKDNFGAETSYNQTTFTITFKKNGTTLSMIKDSTTATVDGTVVNADAPMIIDNNHTYVPAEFVFRKLGAAVIWDESTQCMTVKEVICPVIEVSDAIGAPGEEITVEATLKNNPGVAGAEFKINYDSTAVSYVSGKKGANSFYTAFSPTAGANPVKVVLANLSLKDVSGDVAIGTITFTIPEDAAPGTYSLELADTNLYDSQIVHLKSCVINGSITVTE